MLYEVIVLLHLYPLGSHYNAASIVIFLLWGELNGGICN